MSASIPVFSDRPKAVATPKLRALVQFPSHVIGTNGIGVTKANGTYTFETNWNDFGSISAIPTAPTSYILTFDTAAQMYVMVPSHLLGGAVAGIADAPIDGTLYGRKSAAWVAVTGTGGGGIPEAPTDHVLYGRKDTGWTAVPASIPEAPVDSTQYGRKNGSWTAVPPAGIGDALSDSTLYGRKNGAWVAVPPGGGGVTDAPSDGTQYARNSGAWTTTDFFQSGVGAARRTAQNKMRDFVSIADFGASTGASASANTTAIQAAMNSGALQIYIPDGVFLTGHITIPTTVTHILGSGTLRASGTVASACLLGVTSHPGPLIISDITLDIDPAVYTAHSAINLVFSLNTTIENVYFKNSGVFAVQTTSSSNSSIVRCRIEAFSQHAVSITGGDHCGATGCIITNSNAVAFNTYHVDGGQFHYLKDSTLDANGGVGAFNTQFANCNYSLVSGNTFKNSHLEAFAGSAVTLDIDGLVVTGNVALWPTYAAHDNGFSIGGNVASGHIVRGLTITNNYIQGAGGNAIDIGNNCQDAHVSGNTIIDSGNFYPSAPVTSFYLTSAILISPDTSRCHVLNNMCKRIANANMSYGVYEATVVEVGAGSINQTDYNIISGNTCENLTTTPVHRIGPHTVVGFNPDHTGPGIGAGGGALRDTSLARDADLVVPVQGGLIYWSDLSVGGSALVAYDAGTGSATIILGSSQFVTSDPGTGTSRLVALPTGVLRNRYGSAHVIDYIVLASR